MLRDGLVVRDWTDCEAGKASSIENQAYFITHVKMFKCIESVTLLSFTVLLNLEAVHDI